MGIYENETAAIKDGQCFLYRHSDGYPNAVLPDILPFLARFKQERGIDDTAYCLARLTQHLTNRYDIRNEVAIGAGTLGHGIDTTLHLDIEYFYHISPSAVLCYEVTGESPKSWKLESTTKL